MKKFKVTLTALAIVAGITAAFAFKPAAKHFTNPYWEYNGSGSVTDPANYTLLPGSPDCPGKTDICAIEAPAQASPHTNEPQISSGLAMRITNKDKSDGDVFLQDN